jgi:hypothetical protein
MLLSMRLKQKNPYTDRAVHESHSLRPARPTMSAVLLAKPRFGNANYSLMAIQFA